MKRLNAEIADQRQKLADQRYGDGTEALLKLQDERLSKLKAEKAKGFVQEPGKPKRAPVQTEATRARDAEIKALEAEKKLALKPAQLVARQKLRLTKLEARKAELEKAALEGRKVGYESKARLEAEKTDLQKQIDDLENAIDQLETADGSKANALYRKGLERRIKAMDTLEASGFAKKAKKPELIRDKESEDAANAFEERQQLHFKRQYDDMMKKRTLGKRFIDEALDLKNSFGGLMASFDVSSSRQMIAGIRWTIGNALIGGRPGKSLGIFRRVYGDLFSAIKSESTAMSLHRAVERDVDFAESKAMGVEYGETNPGQFTPGEENMRSRLDDFGRRAFSDAVPSLMTRPQSAADVARGVSQVPKATLLGTAKVVRISNRAFAASLHRMRLELYKEQKAIFFPGGDATEAQLKALAADVNLATGRGNTGRTTKALGKFAWSIELLASRFKSITGVPIWNAAMSGDKVQMKMAASSYAKGIVGWFALYGIKSLFSDEEEKKRYWTKENRERYEKLSFAEKIWEDSLSSDFNKAVVRGDSASVRIDTDAGYQQMAVAISRFMTGATKDIYGTIHSTKPDAAYAAPTREEVLLDFLKGKRHPFIGLLYDKTMLFLNQGTVVKGKKGYKIKDHLTGVSRTVGGTPDHTLGTYEDWMEDLMPVPLSLKETVPIIEKMGFAKGVAIQIATSFFAGAIVYDDDEEKARKASKVSDTKASR